MEVTEVFGFDDVGKVVGWVRSPGHGNAMPLHDVRCPEDRNWFLVGFLLW